MKIIVVNYRYFMSGGPERYMFNFMKLAKKNGDEVVPFSIDYRRNVETKYKKYFVSPAAGKDSVKYSEFKKDIKSLFKIFVRIFYNFEANKKLKKLIKNEKPDLVYIIHQINTLSPSIIVASNKLNVPVIHRISDYNMLCAKYLMLRDKQACELCMYGKYYFGIKYKCVKNSFFASILRVSSMYFHKTFKLYKGVDMFMFPSEFTRQKFISSGRVSKENSVTIPTFVPHIQVKSEKGNYLLCLGRFSTEKGFEYVVKSLVELMDFNVRVKITGDMQDLDDETKTFIFKNNIRDRIDFTGFVRDDELQKLISNSLCVMAPAIWYENLPNAILEAYSYGKPVIASRIGSLNECVEHYKHGFLVEPKNSSEIAKYVKILIKNDELYDNLSGNVIEKARSVYSDKIHYDKFKKTYETIRKRREKK